MTLPLPTLLAIAILVIMVVLIVIRGISQVNSVSGSQPHWSQAQIDAFNAQPRCSRCAVRLVRGGCPNKGCREYLFREQFERDSEPIQICNLFGVPVYRVPDKNGRISRSYNDEVRRRERERDNLWRQAK